MDIHELANHPDWELAPGASDIYASRLLPALTLGPEEEGPGPYSLTDGAGDFFMQGTVVELVNITTFMAAVIAGQQQVHPDWKREVLTEDWNCPTCGRTFVPGPAFRCWRGPGVDEAHVCGQCYVSMVG